MRTASSFTFEHIDYLPQEKRASFSYSTRFSDGSTLHFTEEIRFPRDIPTVSYDTALLERALRSLHLILGISYWKMDRAPEFRFGSIHETGMTYEEHELMNALYTIGLGEFYYHNSIDIPDQIGFPPPQPLQAGSHPGETGESKLSTPVHKVSTPVRSLVAIGGGKDSLVSVELLKSHHRECAAFVVENDPQRVVLDEVLAECNLPVLRVVRKPDSQLRTRTDVLKGHVPISAVYAMIGAVTAILYGYRDIVVSNERSSNYGNIVLHGKEINHQWSKSTAFEKQFSLYCSTVLGSNVRYYSLLRPFSELHIAKIFSKMTKYHEVFSSCNRNFRMQEEENSRLNWCGECAKCAFSFALFAPFISKDSLHNIFGMNLLERDLMIPMYRSLLGLEGIKPFDCVGTPDEVAVSLYCIEARDEYHNSPVISMFRREYLGKIATRSQLETWYTQLLNPSEMHLIPLDCVSCIDSHSRYNNQLFRDERGDGI